jgi:nuclear transport factor 2 (NTF2) superfamily protein
MTIAKQLNITTFPFEIKDEKGRLIYREYINGSWCKWEFDEGKLIYSEDSSGEIIDNRPKSETTILGHWHKGGDK